MNINEINTIYNIYDDNKIKLFGHDFVERNKNNCKVIFDGKEDEFKKKNIKHYHFHFKKK